MQMELLLLCRRVADVSVASVAAPLAARMQKKRRERECIGPSQPSMQDAAAALALDPHACFDDRDILDHDTTRGAGSMPASTTGQRPHNYSVRCHITRTAHRQKAYITSHRSIAGPARLAERRDRLPCWSRDGPRTVER